MTSYEGAKAVFGGLPFTNSHRPNNNLLISRASASRAEGGAVSSTPFQDTSAQDAIMAGGAVALIGVMVLVYLTFCCHVMGLHNKICGLRCWGRRRNREAEGGEESTSDHSPRARGVEGATNDRQVDGMIALLELSTPRISAHLWQAGALRRQAPTVSTTPPPSYSHIYNTKVEKSPGLPPADADLASSDVIALWRIIVEAEDVNISEEDDQDLPVFESPVHSLGNNQPQYTGERCNSPIRPPSLTHHASTLSTFERDVVTSRSVPRLILDDGSDRKISERCSTDREMSSRNFVEYSCPASVSPAYKTIGVNSRLETPKVSFFTSKLGGSEGRIAGGSATHDTGYSSCSTSNSKFGRRFQKVPYSVDRCYTQPRTAIGRTNLHIYRSSLDEVAKHVSESPTRLVLLKYQLTPHGRSMFNLNTKFAPRSRQYFTSTGSYMETIQSKYSATELIEFQNVSESDYENTTINRTILPNSPNESQKSPSCSVYELGKFSQSSPNFNNSTETLDYKLESAVKNGVTDAVGSRVTVRVVLPTGDISSDMAATKEKDDGSGKLSYVATLKAHPLYPIQACSVQVYSGRLSVSVVSIKCLSGDYGVVESFVYGLVTPSDAGTLVDKEATSPRVTGAMPFHVTEPLPDDNVTDL